MNFCGGNGDLRERWFDFRFESETSRTKSDVVVAAEDSDGDAMIIEVGAVSRVEVVNAVAFGGANEEGVVLGDVWFFNLDLAIGFASDDGGDVVYEKRFGFGRLRQQEKFSHI